MRACMPLSNPMSGLDSVTVGAVILTIEKVGVRFETTKRVCGQMVGNF
jgi:hypothetical protein